MMNEVEYRRFKIIADNIEQKESFEELVKQKSLSRKDLILILKSVAIADVGI